MDKILLRASIFQGVDPDSAIALGAQLESVYYPRGSIIFTAGEPGDRVYIIVSGKVKLGQNSPDGRENLLAIMGPADMFGELSVFDPGPCTSSATAVTDVHLATMDREMLREWMTTRSQLAEQLLMVLARRLRRINDDVADLVFTDVPGRVAKALMQLARAAVRGAGRPASAGQTRPHPGRAGPAGRRLPRDR